MCQRTGRVEHIHTFEFSCFNTKVSDDSESDNRLSQTRHNFVGEIRIFSMKIRINPYPSFMH